MLWLGILVLAFISASCDEVQPKVLVSPGDSYLNAYKDSQKATTSTIQASRKEYTPHQGYPDAIYNQPIDNYGAPKPVYGPPVYGPPIPSYGPTGYEPSPFVGVPHAMLGLLDKFKLKLDLFTLGKIVLKLMIFKKVVSLIAILCLLLFIPSLKSHDKEDSMEDDMRSFNHKNTADQKIQELTAFVLEAIEKYDKIQNEEERAVCDSLYCKVSNTVNRINKKMTYDRLFKLYMKETK